jgi:serine/threonine protein kinase
VDPTPEQTEQRFEHYRLVTAEDGKPVELGRGAMGVTYKAFDINLHCPVTLKVISERYLGDESARLRFLREARAAASVRHPNVTSVFHLGRTRSSYFYAMEFVEGETLQNLIKRTDRLDVPLYFLGDFEAARQYVKRGVEIWRAGGVQPQVDETFGHAVGCLFFEAILDWHFGEIASCRSAMAKAISVAKELNNMTALTHAQLRVLL